MLKIFNKTLPRSIKAISFKNEIIKFRDLQWAHSIREGFILEMQTTKSSAAVSWQRRMSSATHGNSASRNPSERWKEALTFAQPLDSHLRASLPKIFHFITFELRPRTWCTWLSTSSRCAWELNWKTKRTEKLEVSGNEICRSRADGNEKLPKNNPRRLLRGIAQQHKLPN